MQSGVALDPMAEFLALGTHPNQGDTPAVGVIGLTLSVEQAGGKASYAPRCTDTDVVGMACERITGEACCHCFPIQLFVDCVHLFSSLSSEGAGSCMP